MDCDKVIATTDESFSPKNFTVYTFYGERTCFCWDQNKLVIFPYTDSNYGTLQVLITPAPIKTIQCFDDRIFLICIPHGIYKVMRNREFAILSKSAIGMGTAFYKVLKPRAGYLYLDDKETKVNKLLFQLSVKEIDSTQLCIYPLNVDNIANDFLKVLTNNDSNIKNLCIIGDGLKLLTLVNETVQIIYSSVYTIKDIMPIQKYSKTAGLFLLTNTDVIIIMYSKDNMLSFETVCLGTQTQAVCAGFSQSSEETLWIVFLYKFTLYYAKKQLSIDDIQKIRVGGKSYLSLQFCDSKTILGLTVDKELVEISTNTIERALSMECDTFINLHSNMLKGAMLIMDEIHRLTQELHFLNKTLIKEEDKLKRINLYAHKQRIRLSPKIMINRIANQLFLSANFQDARPKNSQIVVNVKSQYRHLLCAKKIKDQETVVDIHIPEYVTENVTEIAVDLIVFKNERNPWLLIKNYVIDSYQEQNKRKKLKSNSDFISSKIDKLQAFITKGNVNMKELSDIKRNARRKFSDILS
ncbi:uncharacterized protein LOC143428384 [Xylocopa sonorina]|uniref:uncharacterized protein LOC143428384 n=1 Tax=Xylocopa sonorina TaxID=1818115 RepID=UPI00403A8FD3